MTRKEVFNEPIKPKSSRIGMQMDTTNENVLSSQASLFEDAEDTTYKSDRRVFPDAVSVKPTYVNSKQGFQGRQQEISSAYYLYSSNEKQRPPS